MLLVSINVLLIVFYLSRDAIGCEEDERWLVSVDLLEVKQSRNQLKTLFEHYANTNNLCPGK